MTKKATKTRAKAKPSPTRKPSTALAVRPKAAPARTSHVEVLPADKELERRIGDDILIAGLGTVELKLKPEEEKVLAEAVDERKIMVKPTGQIYLPHAEYTRWFNRAFGRLGWALVPLAKPSKGENTIIIPYMLYIHGQPVALAYGAAEYHPTNKEQTYDDVLEATVAYALRRCAKRIGVSLELWDRSFSNDWVRQHAIKVKLKPKNAGDKPRWQWRRRDDPPFWNEAERSGSRQTGRDEEEEEQPQRRDAPARETPPVDERRQETSHAHMDEVITLGQRQRLAMIVNNSSRSDVEVEDWLRSAYGIQNAKPTREIKRRDYDAICKAIEAPGHLPQGRAR